VIAATVVGVRPRPVLGFPARDADRAPRAGRSATSPHSSAAPISAARRRARAAVLLAALLGGAALSSGSAGAQTASIGSGFLVRPDGWILTVAQVVVGARQIAVTCPERPTVTAVVDQVVPRLDLAMLRVPLEGVPFLSLNLSISVSEAVLVGDTVDTVAYVAADGQKPEAVVGEARVVGLSGPGDAYEFFQISVPRERRGVGGPVVSARGDAIGVLTTLDVMRGPTATGAAPADAPTWTIKAQAARPLFIAPPPQPAARSREDAIARARSATCLIEVTR